MATRWRRRSSRRFEQDFRVEAYSFPELEAAVARKQVDFVLTNPRHFVLISHQQKLSARWPPW